MTVFVYEDVCATGAGGDEASPPAPSLLAEGRAMLAAVTADARAVPGLTVVTAKTAADFDRLATEAEYTLVIAPECGGRLEELCRRVLAVGGRLLGPTPDAVRLAADKLALCRHWQRHGVLTPASRPYSWGQVCDLSIKPDRSETCPHVIKPRDGAGSQATRLSHLAAEPWPGPMVAQEYVEGFPASVACLVGPAGVLPLVPCEQRLSDDGRFHYLGGRLPIAPDLAARATTIAVAAVGCVPGLNGYVGADVVLGDDGRDWAIEINPRLTTSYVGLRRLAVGNLFSAMLEVVGGGTPAIAWRSEVIDFSPS
jgi:tyramine---L-glutamate ligase